MKLGFTIFLTAAVIIQAFSSLNNFSMNQGIDVKSIVACKDCDKR